MNIYRPNNFHSSQSKTPSLLRFPYLSRVVILAFLSSALLIASSQASDPQIDIVDSWVEDGFLFHVAFKAEPSNTICALNGEGLIEFEVAYDAYTSSGVNSAFGVAIWYPGAEADDWIKTQGWARGAQGICGKSNPCHIQAVHVVQMYCPATDGPLYSCIWECD